MNLLSVAAELKEIATERPHDKDGIIGKSGQVLVALCLYCNNNRALEALQPSDKITKEEKPVTQQAEEINSLCNKIITTEIPSPIHAFMENAIPSIPSRRKSTT
jgi:hypothetical protein